MKRVGVKREKQRRTDQGVATHVPFPRVRSSMPRRLRDGDLCVLPVTLTSLFIRAESSRPSAASWYPHHAAAKKQFLERCFCQRHLFGGTACRRRRCLRPSCWHMHWCSLEVRLEWFDLLTYRKDWANRENRTMNFRDRLREGGSVLWSIRFRTRESSFCLTTRARPSRAAETPKQQKKG